MAQQLHGIEKGIELFTPNGDALTRVLAGAAAPGGTTDTDDAGVGSVYKQTTGNLYLKITAGSGTDKWIRIATATDLVSTVKFRGERVRAVTGQAAPTTGSVLDLTASPLSDDDTPFLSASDFAVDDHIIFAAGGTPKLMRVSVVSAPNITVVDANVPLADGDNFLAISYLPDSPDAQELQAIVAYDGTADVMIKVGDINWDFATGINLSAGYAAQNGSISSADTVESAIEKLDGNQIDLTTLSGVAQGSVNLGTFTGLTIQDNRTIKEALQDLETALEGIAVDSSADAVTTAVTLDEMLVDDFLAAKWLVVAELDSAPGANRRAAEVFAAHDGHAGADAANADFTVYAVLKKGTIAGLSISVDLNGSGAGQTMRLRVAATGATSFRAKRLAVAA